MILYQRIGMVMCVALTTSCAATGTPSPSRSPALASASQVAPAPSADALVGVWDTGAVSFDQIRTAMLNSGLTEADFIAWAEGQDLAPWPEDPEMPNELAMQLHFLADGSWEISVDSGGEALGTVDLGTYRLDGGELNLISGGDGDLGTFSVALEGDRLTLALLDTQEVGTDEAAYVHYLYGIALYASAPFVRTLR